MVCKYVYIQHDREDLFQEVFLAIHRGLGSFKETAALGTWIYKVTVNTALNFLKKQRRGQSLAQWLGQLRLVEEVVFPESPESPDAEFKLLAKLNPLQQMVLILAEIEERALAEISDLLKIPLGTVKSNLSRAKEIIRKELLQNG